MPTQNDSLVSIFEASQILGVSEAALRQWTNEGKIKSFVTPGGHRRYAKADLKRFMTAHHKSPGVKDLAVKLEDTAPLHREIAINFLQSIDWYNRLDVDTQRQFAELGRTLLHLIVRSFASPGKQDENAGTLRSVGRRYGELTADLGLSLTDSLQAFLRHRDPILSAVSELMKQGDSVNRRMASLPSVVDRAMDEALIALVAAQQERKGTESRSSEI